MKLIVADASVILKWVFPPDTETYQIEARRLGAALGNGEMVCALPTLWYYEVGNILSRRHPEKTTVLA